MINPPTIGCRRRLALALAAVLLPALAAAEPRHELFLAANPSGQSGVMGSRGLTRSGLYRTLDRVAFEHRGPHHIRLIAMIADPHQAQGLYLTALDGVLHSADAGRTWRTLTGWRETEAKGIAIDPQATDHLYVGLPDGIIVSRDRGATWQRAQEGLPPVRRYVHAVCADSSRSGRVLAGSELGIYLTEDGARSWRRVQPTEKVTYDIRQSPHDPRRFAAANSGGGLFLSEDGGVTWTRAAGVPVGITLHNVDWDPHRAGRLLVCGWGVGVMVSEDHGRTWESRSAGLPVQEVWSARFDPDAPGRILAAPFLKPLSASDDLGASWRPLVFEQAIVFNLCFLPRR